MHVRRGLTSFSLAGAGGLMIVLLLPVFLFLPAGPPWAGPLPPASNPRPERPDRGADLDRECPPASFAPQLQRKTMVMKEGHFGEGTLELRPGLMILRLHGTPYEMGCQHGTLLKQEIRTRLTRASRENDYLRLTLSRKEAMRSFAEDWPAWAREELEGMAAGAGVGVWDLVRLNLMGPGHGDRSHVRLPVLGDQGEPDWMVVFYHPVAGPRTAAVTRPGRVGFSVGMDDRGRCATLEPSFPLRPGFPPELRVREDLLNPGPGEGPSRDQCALAVPDRGDLVWVVLHPGPGLVCASRDQGQSWAAVDLESESYREPCGPCGG